jgi:D-glycero-D-manno-heptose 1,7-bisphosphate phosphatase
MCCHHPNFNCNCRKPKTGLFEQAIKDFNIDVAKSWMIGDKQKDMIAGKKV